MKVHFIAIGGSAMHNLAIALHKKGYTVSGSDDEIFEPSRGRLKKYGLLPKSTGWDENRITGQLDAVILGMHAKADNPELARAKALNLKIYSYPEFLYEQSRNKTRIVIGGSHGKTTITSMILHVMQYHNIKTDYMVGAQLEGFEVMVKITDDAPYMVLEGDEYLSSALDRRPKFHLYQPDIAVLSGIAWDHINVFPTYKEYLDQFRIFIDKIEDQGVLIYCDQDQELKRICEEKQYPQIQLIPYHLPEFQIRNGVTYIKGSGKDYELKVFGSHNLLNISAARNVCKHVGISDEAFLEAIQSFMGASNRLQLLAGDNDVVVYKDFAHAPSKLKATTNAVKEQFPDKKLVACMELHTYSSLNKDFLQEYAHTMDQADEAWVFFNPHALKMKRLPDITAHMIYDAFKKENLKVFSDPQKLEEEILQAKQPDTAFLFMSSGNFGNLDISEIAKELTNKG